MNINDVINSVNSSLTTLGSKLANFSTYSNTYALIRSVAETVITQQELLVANSNSLLIGTASGNALDLKLSDLGIPRLEGTYASGWVLASSPYSSYIPANTTLTDSTGTYQFSLNTGINAGALEATTAITSTTLGSPSNLSAGTPLYNAIYPNVTFLIGKYRDPITKNPLISTAAGVDAEDDESYRARAQSVLLNSNSANNSAVWNSIASVVGTTPFFITEQTPVTGTFTVYLDTADASLISKVDTAVKFSKPLGTAYVLTTISKAPIDILVSLVLSPQASSSSVISQAKVVISSFFSSLRVDDQVLAADIEKRLMNISGIKAVDVRLGGSFLFNPSSISANSIASIGNLSFNVTIST